MLINKKKLWNSFYEYLVISVLYLMCYIISKSYYYYYYKIYIIKKINNIIIR